MFEHDSFETTAGTLTITFVGHGTLMLTCGATVVHVDPVSQEADYEQMPKADLILVTHGHSDHLDVDAIGTLRKPDTEVLLPPSCAASVVGGIAIGPGESRPFRDLKIAAIDAYNIQHERVKGVPFHPKGEGVGYIVGFGGTRVYIAGDTENTREVKALRNIDIAFLPMNLPYTMTPEMVADAARAFRPAVLYPYHFGDTDTDELGRLLAREKEIEVRVRDLS